MMTNRVASAVFALALLAVGLAWPSQDDETTKLRKEVSGVNVVVDDIRARKTTREPRTSLPPSPPTSPELTNRIVGGRPAPRTWLFAASIGRMTGARYRHYCGGSLIRDGWVLTAAHCPVQSTDLVVLGRYDLTQPTGGVFRIDRHVRHPSYDAATTDNDIALIKLVGATSGMTTVGLGPVPAVGASVTATGWGRTTEGGTPSSTLLRVSVPVVPDSQCVAAYGDENVAITRNMFCAGKAGADSCQGDSGGPLLVSAAANLRQVGIVSFGIGCARPGFPGVYTRLQNYTSTAGHQGWIDATIGANGR